LAAAARHDHTLVLVNKHGQVDPVDIKKAIRPDTWLISVGLANNEVGTIQPLSKIAEIIKQVRAERLADGNPTPLICTVMHHKAQGIGLARYSTGHRYVDHSTQPKSTDRSKSDYSTPARSVVLKAQIVGGGQESGLRSGTENVAGVIGMAVALTKADEHRHYEVTRLSDLRNQLQTKLVDAFADAVVLAIQNIVWRAFAYFFPRP